MAKEEGAINGGPKEPMLLKWQGLIMIGMATIIVGFSTLIYGSICKDVDQLDSVQRTNVERVSKLEVQQLSIRETLVEIKSNQADIQHTLNRIMVGLKIESK